MNQVEEFHLAFGCPVLDSVNLKGYPLRVALMNEEFNELKQSTKKSEIADGLGDLLYVTYGTYLALGLKHQWHNRTTTTNLKIAMKVIENCIVTFENYCSFEDYENAQESLNVLITWLYTAASLQGINLEMVFDKIHESNMTKACKNMTDVEKTMKKYEDKKPFFKQLGKYYVVYSKEGKVLKSIQYVPVDLSFLDL